MTGELAGEKDALLDKSRVGHVQSSAARDDNEVDGKKLKKELTVLYGVGYLISDIIGSGIFLSPNGVIAKAGSYGLALIIWIISGLIATGGALCYSELGTFVKKSGSEYAYIGEAYSFRKKNHYVTTLGECMAFINVWMVLVVSSPMSTAVVALLAAEYMVKPFYLDCESPVLIVKLMAVVAVAIPAMVNAYSVRLTLQLSAFITFVKFVAVGFIVALGVYYLCIGCNRAFTDDFFKGSHHSASSISLGLYAALWSYDGWNALNFISEEAKDDKTLPRAVCIGMPIIIVCYTIINLSFFAVLSVGEIVDTTAVALPFAYQTIGTAGEVIFSLLVTLSTFGAITVNIVSDTRVKFVAARDGLLPSFLCGVHNTYNTPLPAVVVSSLFTILMIIPSNLNQLINSYSLAMWVFYGLVFAGLLIMRVTHRDVKRPFKVILPLPVVMVLVAIFLVFIPIIGEPVDAAIAVGLILPAIPVYFIFVYKYKHRPKIFTRINAAITRFSNRLFNSTLSRYFESSF